VQSHTSGKNGCLIAGFRWCSVVAFTVSPLFLLCSPLSHFPLFYTCISKSRVLNPEREHDCETPPKMTENVCDDVERTSSLLARRSRDHNISDGAKNKKGRGSSRSSSGLKGKRLREEAPKRIEREREFQRLAKKSE